MRKKSTRNPYLDSPLRVIRISEVSNSTGTSQDDSISIESCHRREQFFDAKLKPSISRTSRDFLLTLPLLELRLFLIIATDMVKDKGYVVLDPAKLVIELGKPKTDRLSYSRLHQAITVLREKGIITKDINWRYWVNPNYIWYGNLVKYMQENDGNIQVVAERTEMVTDIPGTGELAPAEEAA